MAKEPFYQRLVVDEPTCREIMEALQVPCNQRHRNGWQARLSPRSIIVVDKEDNPNGGLNCRIRLEGAHKEIETAHRTAVRIIDRRRREGIEARNREDAERRRNPEKAPKPARSLAEMLGDVP